VALGLGFNVRRHFFIVVHATPTQARKRAVVAAALEEGREGANGANKLTMEVGLGCNQNRVFC
jgi:hypothetical protein